MISFVCWKWADAGNGRLFLAEHVNVLRSSIARFANFPHRFICVTAEPAGLHKRVEVVKPPPDLFGQLVAPGPAAKVRHPKPPRAAKVTKKKRRRPLDHLGRLLPRGRQFTLTGPAATLDQVLEDPPTRAVVPTSGPKLFPSCWRRLWNFCDTWAPAHLGERIMALDIDCVVTGDLSPLVNRSADFVGWSDERFGWPKIAGGAYLLRTGTHADVFDDFDAESSPMLARAAGFSGSDQSWMSFKLYPSAAHWSSRDGVVKLNWLPRHQPDVPAGTRLVFTGGNCPPWNPDLQRLYPWITRYWQK